MTEAMTVRDMISFVNGEQSNIRLGYKRVYRVPGTTRGGAYITCGGDEYPLGRKGETATIRVSEVASMLRHFGHENLLTVLFPEAAGADDG